MPSPGAKDTFELVARVVEFCLLVVVSWDRVSRWIYRRESNDKALAEKVAKFDAGWDDKAEAGMVQDLDEKVDAVRAGLEVELKEVGEWYRNKFAELNLAIGKLATLRDVDILRLELQQLRARVDGHFDKGH